MAVTKRAGLTSIFIVSLLCIVSFQNCAVELSDQTYGAASICSPTGAQEVDFAAALSNFFQNTGTVGGGKQACGACHLTDSGNSAATRFGISPETDADSAKANWCAASSRASDMANGYLNSSHPGGTYTESEVQELVDWARTIE